MQRITTCFLLLGIVPLMLIGCGGSANSVAPGPSGTAGQAQGVYSGTASSGFSFDSIVLPNDKYYAIYGTVSGNVFLIYGMLAGQGTSNNGTYTASVTDFYYTGATYTGSVSATYVVGSSLNGTVTENGTAISFTGTPMPSSTFNFNTPASLSDITGTWTGTLLDGTVATVTINANGSFNGSDSGCSFSGTITPDSSNKNFFNVSLTFGGSPCLLPNQTVSGIAIDYLLSNGVTRHLLAGLTSGTSGTVFAAQR